MRCYQKCFGSENDQRRSGLDKALHGFYSSYQGYEAFESGNWKPEFWAPIRAEIEAILSSGTCKVLEIGAGRTGFADYLGSLRNRVEFHVQDITDRNSEYLLQKADKVHVGDAIDINETYDIIFSTFAYEHITRPRATIEHLLRIVTTRGCIFLASPRYDCPFYISPSARHLQWFHRLAIAGGLMFRRLGVLSGGTPLFLIHFDPAVLHRPWFRDADAVHWPSLWDLERILPDDYVLQRLRIAAPSLRGRFWARFLLLFVRIGSRNRSVNQRWCTVGRTAENAMPPPQTVCVSPEDSSAGPRPYGS